MAKLFARLVKVLFAALICSLLLVLPHDMCGAIRDEWCAHPEKRIVSTQEVCCRHVTFRACQTQVGSPSWHLSNSSHFLAASTRWSQVKGASELLSSEPNLKTARGGGREAREWGEEGLELCVPA